MNESPLFHSSARRPLSRKSPSDDELVFQPLVAEFSRPIAPSRTAFAPAADCTSSGLMMSGSRTSRTSVGVQPATVSIPAATAIDTTYTARRTIAPRTAAVVYEVIGDVILVAEG